MRHAEIALVEIDAAISWVINYSSLPVHQIYT